MLIKKAADALGDVASKLNMDQEKAFEYVVRNTLKIYHVFDLEGYLLLIDKIGNMETLRFSEVRANTSLIDKMMVSAKLRPKPQPKPIVASERFSALVESELVEAVELQAGVFGFSRTDLYNRLVIVGSCLAIHLKDGEAYAYNKKGEGLGRVKFTTS
jgi:hypothetical protein